MIDEKFHTVKRVAQNLRFTRNLNYARRNLGITQMFLCVIINKIVYVCL